MSDGITIGTNITGFDQLDKLLQRLPERVEKKILQKSVNKAMRTVLKDFKAAAPVHTGEQSDASERYGTIKKNLKVVRLRRTKRGQKGARIDTTDSFWAHIYEFGSRSQPARPWFLPVFRKSEVTILKALGAELGKNIEKEADIMRRGG